MSRKEIQLSTIIDAIQERPPCRWEKHQYVVQDGDLSGEVEVVLDMGHNPAAVAALLRRIDREYPAANTR